MKKFFIAIIAALFASGAFAQDTAFPDIPANHWAGDAVSRIADLGIVIGFPDGTFRGNESFTRYQAALVISRTLDVINENVDSALAMTEEDLASLRNAVQELASDVAAQGVRLSAAESAIASISDDVTANSARLDEIESMSGEGMDSEVLRELQNQIASLRVAADTAQAQAEAAEARANDAFNRANQALAAAEENAAAIDALTEAVRVLNEMAGQPTGPGMPAGLADAVARNSEDIANIREFVILLRRDQVALRDRVAALEGSDEEQSAAISDLQERVTALEENPLGISGEITIEYGVVRFAGDDFFDVDRAFGFGLPRGEASFFSSGESDDDEEDNQEIQDYGYNPEDDDDGVDEFTGAGPDGNVSSNLDVTAELSFTFNTEFDGTGPLGTESFSAVVNLGVAEGDVDDDGEPDFAIELQDIVVNYDPIGAAPLTFEYGEDLDETFTGYILDTEGVIGDAAHNEGFVVTVGTPEFLAFLDPTLTGVYATADDTDNFIRGVRGTLSPFDGLTGGVSFAQLATNAGEFGDLNEDNQTTTVWGLDASATISVLTLNGEYASSSTTDNGTDTTTDNGTILFVEAEVDVGELGIPILDSLSANYRAIDEDWFSSATDGITGLVGDDDDEPNDGDAEFVEDQVGFGVMGGLDLFGLLMVEGYFDSYSVTTPTEDNVSAFGVDATADLPLGFVLEGFYHMASVGGEAVGNLEDGNDDPDEAEIAGGYDRNENYDTGFGVTLAHDGSSDRALIDNLNLSFTYSQTDADFDTTTLDFDADYELSISILTLTPYVGYESVVDADDGTDDTTTLEAGTGLTATLASLPAVGETTLGADVNYRNTVHSDADEYTSTVLQYSVGVEFGAFLFGENSDLSVDYGSFTGTNIATNPDDYDDENTGETSSVTGYEIVWDYYGLEFGYGVFVYDPDTDTDGDTSNAQEFSISYTVTF